MLWKEFDEWIQIHIREYKDDQNTEDWMYYGRIGSTIWPKILNKDEITINVSGDVIRFLKEWGKMHRVIGKRIKKYGGEKEFYKELTNALKSISPLLNEIERIRLELGNLKDLVDIIKKTFHILDPTISITSTSKVLHMSAPQFYIMWDDEIRQAYGVKGSPEGYYTFLRIIKDEANELIGDFKKQNPKVTSVEVYYNKISGRSIPLLGWIDRYNWIRYTKERRVTEVIPLGIELPE